MSNSGVNTGFAKCFIIFMAIVIMLQGVVYLGLSIWGITLEKCSTEASDISQQPFQFVLDIIYFANEDCGEPVIKIPAISEEYNLTMNWQKSFDITNRMNIFLITYASISALWIITSLLVIITIYGPVTKTVSAVVYWPWFLVVMAGCILDAVATGYFVTDIIHTTSAQETFEYTGITVNDANILTYLSSYDAYFITPALVMTLLSCRVVLIWLLNIFGTIFCLSLSNVLAKRNSIDKRIDSAAFAATANTASSARNMEPSMPQSQQLHQPNLLPNPQFMEQNPPQIMPKPLPIQAAGPVQRQSSYQQQPQQLYPRVDRRSFEPLKSPAEQYGASAPALSSNGNNLRINTASNEQSTYHNTDTHPDKLDYPAHSSTPSDTRVTSQELAVASPLNNRYSNQEGPQFPSSQQPQRVSDELRSQLPWSYTSMLSKPQPPRRQPSQMSGVDSIHVETPEPDYSLPTHRNDRPNSGNDINGQQPQSYSRW